MMWASPSWCACAMKPPSKCKRTLPSRRRRTSNRRLLARLGCAWLPVTSPGGRLRVVWVQKADGEILELVTNLGPEELSAADLALLYKRRWQEELFFRWLKCILGCRHWLAESPQGAAIELYLALIAALLLQLYTGLRPNRRLMEMIWWYLMG